METVSQIEKEKRFFSWLFLNIPDQAEEIRSNYRLIESLLLQKHAIAIHLVDIDLKPSTYRCFYGLMEDEPFDLIKVSAG